MTEDPSSLLELRRGKQRSEERRRRTQVRRKRMEGARVRELSIALRAEGKAHGVKG